MAEVTPKDGDPVDLQKAAVLTRALLSANKYEFKL